MGKGGGGGGERKEEGEKVIVSGKSSGVDKFVCNIRHPSPVFGGCQGTLWPARGGGGPDTKAVIR